MNYIDIILGIILILSAINGFKKGFIHQLASLAAIILGIFIAVKFSKAISPFILNHFTSSENAARVTAFIVVFVLVAIAVHLLAKFLEKTLEEVELGSLNRIAGLAFGLIKTIFIVSALMVLLKVSVIKFNWPDQKDRDNSYLYKPIESVAPAIFPYLKLGEENKNTSSHTK
jgi:membrane protein required for colicin V production